MDLSKIKIIFIPGNDGSSVTDHWFPYLKKEFEKLGLNVTAKEFPDPVLAREKYWLPFLKNELHADENSILIGHSSGAIAAMRYAEKNRILGSILVGTYYTDLGNEMEVKSGYFNRSWKWLDIQKNQKWIVQYGSCDDPYISIEEARYVHEKLQTEYYEYANAGHFGDEYLEKTTFPEIVKVIKEKLGLG